MSLINHDGVSLDCGHDVSDVFDSSIGIWWHYDDNNITQISDLPNGVYYRETQKTHETENKKDRRINMNIVCCLYQNKPSDKTQL